jgi:hypothetical protein
MELKDIATVSGKGGLFRVLKPSRGGVILESLDAEKKKMIAGPNHRVSVLNEISIYTTDSEGSVPLEDVFRKMYEEFKDDTGVDPNSDSDELKSFLKHILPDYDDEQVYVSDIKKLVKWYGILLEKCPEIFETSSEANAEQKQNAGKGKQSNPGKNNQ